jgi:hypothetical protein
MAQDQTSKKDDGQDLIAEFRRITAAADFDGKLPDAKQTDAASAPLTRRPPPLPDAPGLSTGTVFPNSAGANTAGVAQNAPEPTLPPAGAALAAAEPRDRGERMPPALPLPPHASATAFANEAPPLPISPGMRPLPGELPASAPEVARDHPGDTIDGDPDDGATTRRSDRRAAQRRAAMPSRDQIAANDDAPSIGGLIYALNQKPSKRPFSIASIASMFWAGLTVAFGAYFWGSEIASGTSVASIIGRPELLMLVATLLGPIGLMYALATIAYRTEEMRLRSSAMTEVAVRLAEPDRMAEQSVASLGQAVRRQVSFMNDAVSRALGRAGELEALVHSEVTALERSYQENERKIRALIQELSGERDALASTSERMSGTLKSMGGEVPELIEKLSAQQIKLAKIIEGAGQNLTQLENAMATQTGAFETVVGDRTERLQTVLSDYTHALSSSLDQRMEMIGSSIASRTGDLQVVFEEYTRALDTTLGNRAEAMSGQMAQQLVALDSQLGERTAEMDQKLGQRAAQMDASISRAADTLVERAQLLDHQLIERTKALDDAFADRLRLFDDAILRSTTAIDHSINDKTLALTSALDQHAKSMGDTLARQSLELDESLLQGITAVRRTSENITRQSIKALEGLAGQSELLKSVSENLLSQINTITNRFDNQGQQIMRAANALETVNYKIDKTLQNRQVELSQTLDRLEGKAEEFDRAALGYSRQIEGTISQAETRARSLTAEISQTAEERSRAAIADIERLRATAADTTERAIDDLRSRFSNVSTEVSQGLTSLTDQFSEATGEARRRANEAINQLAGEQERLRAQAQSLPNTTRESADAMRRVLSDHLRAFDQLSSLSSREAGARDVSRPLPPAQALVPIPTPPQREENRQAINTLGAALSHEMQARARQAPQAPPSPPAAVTPPPRSPQPAPDARDAWSLGDLLKRASHDDPATHQASHQTLQQPTQITPQGFAPAAHHASHQPPPATRSGLDFAAIARALDPATAGAIWQRLAAGQRGIMVRSIYSPEGRGLFDETLARLANEPGFADTTQQYLIDFERVLQEADRQDPSGQTADGHLRSDYGRAYLFLAHAAGRIV